MICPTGRLNSSEPEDIRLNNKFCYFRCNFRTEVITAINDCALRSRATSQFVAFADLDEIFIAQNHSKVSFKHEVVHIQTCKN